MPYKDKEKVREAQRRYYAENPDLYRQRKRDRRNRLRKQIDASKDRPCMDCGIQYPPYIMDFDHRPDEQKLFNIGNSVQTYTLEALQAEIAKCDVVCSNCHRHRTWLRQRG